MKDTVKIAYCTTCKGRADHIRQTLPANLDSNTIPDVKFVLLNYSSPDGLEEYIRLNHWRDIADGRLAFYTYPTTGPFRMAHAKNMAHRLAIMEGADVLVNLDADNYTGPSFDKYIAERMRRPERFMFAQMIRGVLPRGISGRIAVHKTAFLKAGGYDEKYETWAPDDKDFNARLQRLGYEPQKIENEYLLAINHNDKKRFSEYPEAKGEAYDLFQSVSSDATVVNGGKIGCGDVLHLCWRDGTLCTVPMTIDPLPTRVFGVGLHKTATTSLCKALRILGFEAGHWENAHWAKAIYNEMTTDGRSPTLERHYALCDLPISVLFRELDRGYPGSKFILTVRSADAWLESVRRHWSHEHNPYRGAWNADPFTHRMHKIVYGQKGFEPQLFIERYRRHNLEVAEHFKDRPDDLLVLEMEQPRLWEKLCGFLGCPVPGVPYPNEFVTARRWRPDFQI